MAPERRRRRLLALQMLVLATLCWGLSFPAMRAMAFVQQNLVPDATSWFFSALCMGLRFLLAGCILLIVLAPSLKKITRLEIWQGLGLSLFGASGLVLQMDALAYMSASGSAFLTQFYCIVIPIVVALRHQKWPPLIIWICCCIVLVGVAVLAQVDWHSLRLARGEAETLLGSILFSGQILWLDRPRFKTNHVGRMTTVMFLTTGAFCIGVAAFNSTRSAHWLAVTQSGYIWIFLSGLVLICTLGAYLLMNKFQPELTATEAGLIYCVEPVFASAYAAFLPNVFSQLAHINYPNERLTQNILIGGALITGANLLLQIRSKDL